MNQYVLVAIGSALGGVLRHWLASMVQARAGEPFPAGTLFVNVTGSLLIGFLFGLITATDRPAFGETGRHLLLVGVLGGYTTFSAFSLQTLQLAQEGRWSLVALNIVGSLVLCLLAVWLGHTLGQTMAR